MSNEEIKMPELKPGYVIRDKLGRFLLVVSSEHAYVLTRTDNGDLHIDTLTTHWTRAEANVRVYGWDGHWLTVSDLKDIVYDDNVSYLLWQRPDPIKEMTMEDLEKHFGCKVKIVKDK